MSNIVPIRPRDLLPMNPGAGAEGTFEHLAANRLRMICKASGQNLPDLLHAAIIKAWGKDIEASIRLGKSSKLKV